MSRKLIYLALAAWPFVGALGQASSSPYDRVAFWDSRFPTGWADESITVEVRDGLQAAGYTVLNADELKTWMDARIADKKLSVVVLCRDNAPNTVVESNSQDCTLRKYLDAGGKIVAYADIPFWNVATSTGSLNNYAGAGCANILGITGVDWTNNTNTVVTLTEDGVKWGLTQTWTSTRWTPVGEGMTVLATDASGNAAAWVKHFVPGDTFRGFVRIWDVDVTATSRPSVEEIMAVAEYAIALETAMSPNPTDKASDVPCDTILRWTPGQYAQTHDVYFGTSFDDVNAASRTSPQGVLVSQGQDATTYDPPGLLAFGQTYYWRIDEANAPPDSTVYKGTTWSFTAEPAGYPVNPIMATASSKSNALAGPERTIDGSGLDGLDHHSTEATDMWLSKKNVTPIWIQYEFDRPYKLYQMWVWNQNQMSELDIGIGAMEVSIEVSTDGNTWTALANVPEFAQATGEPNYVHNTTVDFGGVPAKYVKLNIISNWGGLKQAGLSEVRFFYIPLKAFGPAPTSGTTSVALDAVLNWRPGREAVKHEVSLGTDPNAMTLVKTLTEHTYALGSAGLEYGRTYYWKVNEVNDAASPRSWAGDVWSFTTPGYSVVDDFESYSDLCNRIFWTWVDQYGYNATPECGGASAVGNGTGSTVGNAQAPYADKTIKHSGSQSMPFGYDNTKSTTSEAERTFATSQDWTANGIKSLSLWFYGTAGNIGQLYIKIDNTKVVYEGDATDIGRTGWQPWNIALSTVNGVNLKGVRKLVIGVEGGATGKLYIDDIRLYPKTPEFITPVQPSNAGLVARYTFDGNVNDSSGKGFNGTANGATVTYVTGLSGQAIVLNGTDNMVVVDSVGIAAGAVRTVSGWAKASQTGIPAWTNVFGFTGTSNNNQFFDIEAVGDSGTNATLGWYGLHRYGWERNIMPIDLEWHHLAATYDGTTAAWYGDGKFVGSDPVATADLAATGTVRMGNRGENTNFFPGSLDDVRIYNRALSDAEIGGLAGRTKPMQKPF